MESAEIKNLLQLVAHLRSDNGCEWDKKQNFQSMTPHLLEEAYEVVNAIEENDFENLKEELGDLLFHVAFQAKLAEEKSFFSFPDIVKNISEKLIRRHPHIFQSKQELSSDEVIQNWEKIKKIEKPITKSILEGIPNSFGSLLKAEKIQERAASSGFDWDKISDVEKKITEELNEFLIEVHHLDKNKNRERLEEEFGDILFSLVNLSRHLSISTEKALNKSNLKFIKRFQEMEKISQEDGKSFSKLTIEEMNSLWEKAKKTLS